MQQTSPLTSTGQSRAPQAAQVRTFLDQLTGEPDESSSPSTLGELIDALLVWQTLVDHGVAAEDGAEAAKAGLSPDAYLQAKGVGASHGEIMHASSLVDLVTYVRVRRHLAHDDAVPAAAYCEQHDVDAGEYDAARATGASHDQVAEAVTAGALDAYVTTRRCGRRYGVTHDEALMVATQTTTRHDYPNALQWGAAHTEILAAARAGIRVERYGRARQDGLAHDDAIAAVSAGVSALGVRAGLSAGLTLEEAIEWMALRHHLQRLTAAGFCTHVRPLSTERRALLRGMAPTWTSTQKALLQAVRKLAS